MTSAPHALQGAVFRALSNDADLVGILGPNKLFDQMPEKVSPPYVVHGTTRTTDWSTSTEKGARIEFTLHTWCNTHDRTQSHAIQDRIKSRLIDEQIELQNHHLVSMNLLFTETFRDRNSKYFHGVMRFRGVTEPAA